MNQRFKRSLMSLSLTSINSMVEFCCASCANVACTVSISLTQSYEKQFPSFDRRVIWPLTAWIQVNSV